MHIDLLFVPLIDAGIATPVNLRTTWTLDDVYDALECMAVSRENERLATTKGR